MTPAAEPVAFGREIPAGAGPEKLCARILHLSEAMRQAARAQDWIAAAAYERARRDLLEAFFSSSHGLGAESLAAFIGRLLAGDREVMEWGRCGRRELLCRLETLHRGQRAHRAYRDSEG
jgi:hypothetical protein